jgi:hypothetical protein
LRVGAWSDATQRENTMRNATIQAQWDALERARRNARYERDEYKKSELEKLRRRYLAGTMTRAQYDWRLRVIEDMSRRIYQTALNRA